MSKYKSKVGWMKFAIASIKLVFNVFWKSKREMEMFDKF